MTIAIVIIVVAIKMIEKVPDKSYYIQCYIRK